MASDTGSPQTFNPRLVAALIVAGIVAFAAFMVLSAYADDFRAGHDGRPHALSISAVGFQGITKLLDEAGGTVEFVRNTSELDTENLLVVAVEAATDRKAVDEIVEARVGQPTLLIFPKWTVVADPAHKGWVKSVGVGESGTIAALLPKGTKVTTEGGVKRRAWATGTELLDGVRVPEPKQPQSLSGAEITPLLTTDRGGILLGRVGDGALFVLADPDLMNNHGLKDVRTARAALQILAQLNSTDATAVAFDLTLNGFGRKPNALKLLFEPPFLPLTLALVLAALLAGFHGAFRFGPEQIDERAIAFGKVALVENSAGLIQLTQREHRTGPGYAELIREAAAQASGAPPAIHGEDLDQYLDRLSPEDAPRFSSLARRVRDASDRFELVSAARALFLWKKDNIQ